MKSKSGKCSQCRIRFNFRNDPEDTQYQSTLCRNCSFIVRCLSVVIQSFPPRLNREVVLVFEKGLFISKKRKV